MATTIASAPSWGAIARAQLRMVALLQKRDFLVLAAIGVALLALSFWGLSRIPDIPPDERTLPEFFTIFQALGVPLAALGAIWPLSVWRKDPPESRGYFWSLPVPRSLHTLSRIVAGWLLLMAVCVVTIVLGLAIAWMYSAQVEAPLGLDFWYIPLTAATLTYVLISTPVVLVDSPIRWFVFGWVLVVMTAGIADDMEMRTLDAAIENVFMSFPVAVWGPSQEFPISGGWDRHYLIWLGGGLAALAGSQFLRRDTK